ncbi:MAG: hypothetical protein HDS43_00845, partial [Bacteroides sp.]|nr:hypothetical protein [Bacteroides sp.]
MMFILGDLLAYSLEAGIFLLVTYMGWRFLLYGSTFHRFNRLVLLSGIFISMVLPILISFIPDNSFNAEVGIGALTSLVIDSPAIQAEETNNVLKKYWREILVSLYALGIACVVLWMLISNIRLMSIIKKSHNLDADYPYIKVSDEVAGSFSWGKYIILGYRDIDENLQRVIQHEQIHISRKHWADLLLVQLILIIEWYNPVVWLIFHGLKINHEFEVDSAIPSDDRYEYSLMLLQKTTYKHHFRITDGLNSNLKIRLKMINKQNSTRLRGWAAVLILPLIALTSYGVSRPQTERVINSVKPVATLSEVVSAQKKVDKNKDGGDSKDVLKVGTEKGDSIIVVGVGKGSDPELEAMLSGKKSGAKPAVFVDGVRYTRGLETIDKSDIESITVRRDMPEFPNGAIYVVTKKILDLSKSKAAIFVDGVRFTKDINTIDPSQIESI